MNLQKHFVLVALSIGLLCQIQVAEAYLELVEDNGFTYFYEVIRPGTSHPGVGPVSSLKLAQYAATAYYEMINTNNNPMPTVMTALWLPTTQEIILASNAKGRGQPGGQGFAYHPGNIPMALQINLEAAAAIGTRYRGWVTDTHNKGGACGEIVAMSVFFTRYPNEVNIPGQPWVKFVSVTQHSPNGPIVVVDACSGSDQGPGCREVLQELGFGWCRDYQVPDPLKKRQELSQAGVLERHQPNTDDDEEQEFKELLSMVFECFKALDVKDGAPFPTTISSVAATSFVLESDSATAIATIAPGEIETQADPPSGTAVDSNGNPVTTLVPVVSPTPPPATPNPQIAPDSGKPGGNAPAGSPHNPGDGSGTNTNPQDPYANSGPSSVNPPKKFIRSVADWVGGLFR